MYSFKSYGPFNEGSACHSRNNLFMYTCSSLLNLFCSQSPNLNRGLTGMPENPALTDNWDDAEGYYSEFEWGNVRGITKSTATMSKNI